MNTSSKENNSPLLVGITGGIGSGKSTVSKIIQAMGIPVFNSDVEAKRIVNNDEQLREEIISAFGDVYTAGKLDAQKLSALVFNDAKALQKLNQLVHPKVGSAFDHWTAANQHEPILMKEAAILIESGAYKELDELILIEAPKELRLARVTRRDKVQEEEVMKRMDQQLSDQEKKDYCNYVILNNDQQLLIPQVLTILQELKKPR